MFANLGFVKYTSLCGISLIIAICFVSVFLTNLGSCHTEKPNLLNLVKFFDLFDNYKNINHISKKPKLAILVPFRERFSELVEFAPYMTKFLNKQNIPHHIFLLNQVDSYRFNRASLINVGFLHIKSNFDYMAMHDIDLLPLNDNLKYEYPTEGPLHIAGPQYHPRYNYKNFIGGILLFTCEHYEAVNGMSNRYWGWGSEDDELFMRILEKDLPISRPINITTGITDSFLDLHQQMNRERDFQRCFDQNEATRGRDRETGLNNVQYKLIDKKEIIVEKTRVTVLNIELICDKKLTPWCDCNPKTTKHLKKV